MSQRMFLQNSTPTRSEALECSIRLCTVVFSQGIRFKPVAGVQIVERGGQITGAESERLEVAN